MSSPLLLLKEGSHAPPFFISHGLGGHVTEVSKIVEFLNIDSPVYGIQWHGRGGQEPLPDSIPEMASNFADAIVASFPDGPYLLAGISIGGVVMLEVAQQLSRRNREVALLVLLDSYPHPSYWPIGCWISTTGKTALYHASKIVEMPFRSAMSELLYRSRNFLGYLLSRHGVPGQVNRTSDKETPAELRRMQNQVLTAFRQYRPQYYPQKITFLQADTPTRFPNDATKVWSNLASSIEVHKFPCEHTALSSTYAAQVAACLSNCTERAVSRSLSTK